MKIRDMMSSEFAFELDVEGYEAEINDNNNIEIEVKIRHHDMPGILITLGKSEQAELSKLINIAENRRASEPRSLKNNIKEYYTEIGSCAYDKWKEFESNKTVVLSDEEFSGDWDSIERCSPVTAIDYSVGIIQSVDPTHELLRAGDYVLVPGFRYVGEDVHFMRKLDLD